MRQTTVHFPDGTWNQGVIDRDMRIGEKVIIEGNKQIFIVVDIQHQFRSGKHGNELMYMMDNVILEYFRPGEE